jgi:hypothetical protein
MADDEWIDNREFGRLMGRSGKNWTNDHWKKHRDNPMFPKKYVEDDGNTAPVKWQRGEVIRWRDHLLHPVDRPPGAYDPAPSDQQQGEQPPDEEAPPAKRGRGRPRGSIKKPRLDLILPMLVLLGGAAGSCTHCLLPFEHGGQMAGEMMDMAQASLI